MISADFLGAGATLFGVMLGAATTWHQIRSHAPVSRAHLKADIEIMKSLDLSDPSYPIVQQYIQSRVSRVYGRLSLNSTGQSENLQPIWWSVAIGLVLFAGFVIWTVFIVRDGFTWWAVLTVFFAMCALGLVQDGLHPPPEFEPPGRRTDTSDQGTEGQGKVLFPHYYGFRSPANAVILMTMQTVVVFGFGVWTGVLLDNQWNWWALVTGFLGLVSGGSVAVLLRDTPADDGGGRDDGERVMV